MMMSVSIGGAKYCPTSPAQLSDSLSGNKYSISGSGNNYCPISSYEPEMERPDSPGSAASATHGGATLKRRRSGSEVDSGSSSFKKKKPRNRCPFMEAGVDATTRRRAIMALRANYMGGFPVNKNRKKKATSPIATLAKDWSSDQLSKLKDLMLRWGKLEQAQSQLDRDRAMLIQEHAQLLAAWS